MKKTSIYLEPELDLALARRATITGVTKAELIRETLRAVAGRVAPSRGITRDRRRLTAPGTSRATSTAHLGETGFGAY